MKKSFPSKSAFAIFVILLLAGLIYVFIPRSTLSFVKTPEKITHCDIICDKFTSAESLVLSGDQLAPILEKLEHMKVQYRGVYDGMMREAGTWTYRLYFTWQNETEGGELGSLLIDENGFIYDIDTDTRHKIMGQGSNALSSMLRSLFTLETGES